MSDRRVLFATAFLRALATGMIGILLGLHLARLGLDPAGIGAVVGAGLIGAALGAALVSLWGDRHGRRRLLIATALVSAAGGALLALSTGLPALLAAALVGMVNGMGRDRGAALILEQAMLPATAGEADRTRAFAWYNVIQDAGHALGGLCAALPSVFEQVAGVDALAASRVAVGVYALLALLPVLLYRRLTPGVEVQAPLAIRALSPETRRRLASISALFALDGLGGGFLTTALLSCFFLERFGASALTIGVLFFLARVLNALSHLGAAWLARRIGLVNTMVFTHIPSSLLLVTVAWAPSFAVAAALFLLREGLVEMDVPTRQSYVMAVVRPEERTLASGVTHLVRLAAWSIAPFAAGWSMARYHPTAPLVVGAVLKISYDILLWLRFRSLRPPEEQE